MEFAVQQKQEEKTLRQQMLEAHKDIQKHPLAGKTFSGMIDVVSNLEKLSGQEKSELTEIEKSQFLDDFSQAMTQYEAQHIGGADSWFDVRDWLEAQNLVLHLPDFVHDFMNSKVGYIDLVAYTRFLHFANEEDIETAKSVIGKYGYSVFSLLGCLNYLPTIAPPKFIKKIDESDQRLVQESIQYVVTGLEKLYLLLSDNANLLDSIKGDRKKMYGVFEMIEKRNKVLNPIANKMFTGFFDYIQTGNVDSLDTIIHKNQKLSIFTSITSVYKEMNRPIDLEALNGAEILELTGADIEKDPKLKQRMIEIITENYKKDPELQMAARDIFNKKVGDSNIEFVTIMYEGELAAFCRLENKGDEKYWGSLNVDPHSKGSDIGSTMLEYIMEQKYPDIVLNAHATAELPALSTYLKRGFIARAVTDTNNISMLEIVRDRTILEYVKTAEKTTQKLESRKQIMDASRELFINGYIITAITEHEDKTIEVEYVYSPTTTVQSEE